MPGETAGRTGAIYLALFFMLILQKHCCSPFYPSSLPPVISATDSFHSVPVFLFLIFFPNLGPLFSFFHSFNNMLVTMWDTAVTQTCNSHHVHGAYTQLRWGGVQRIKE